MKIRLILNTMLITCMSFGLTSCISDDWFDDDWWEDGGWQDDRRAESVIRGRWFVDYVGVSDERCPYFETDEFNFKGNGRVDIVGDNGFRESGYWWVDDRYLLIDFDGDRRADWEGYIDRLYRGFLSLHVQDYDFSSRYYLELGR